MALTLVFALPASASPVTYDLNLTHIDSFGQIDGTNSIDTASFSYISSSGFITSDLNNVPVSGCTISNSNWGCSTAIFEIGSPNRYGGADAFIEFDATTTGIGFGGNLFFDVGALGAFGVYPVRSPSDLSGFGSFAQGTLTVEATATPLPAALPLFAGGLGMISLLGARKRRKAQAA
jgi:hypothetical protein